MTRPTVCAHRPSCGANDPRRQPPEVGHAQRLDPVSQQAQHAGRSVSAATTATSTTRIAPAARLTKIFVGTISIPDEREDDRHPAEEHGAAGGALRPRAIAPTCSCPPRRSSRKRETMKSE